MLFKDFTTNFALFLLKGSRSYKIISILQSEIDQFNYYKSFVELEHIDSGTIYKGVAEANSRPLANLRATAEAYERSLYSKADQEINESLPFGIGCGFSKKASLLRAYGEYYERLMTQEFLLNDIEEQNFNFKCPNGIVFVSIKKFDDNTIGSGYGLTPIEAKESAFRSFLRKKSFPQEISQFSRPECEPNMIRITPLKGAWLECYVVGHFSR